MIVSVSALPLLSLAVNLQVVAQSPQTPKPVDGQAFVEARGGRVALAPLLGGRSTTATIDRMSSGKAVGKNGAVSDR